MIMETPTQPSPRIGSEKQLDEIFNLHALTEPGIRGKGGE
jgi:hypothetical protein